jgi:hypothetical protein
MTRIGHCGPTKNDCICLQQGCYKCCGNCKVCKEDTDYYIDLSKEFVEGFAENMIKDKQELFDRLADS